MKIGIAMTFVDGISGGRLHAFMLAAELAAQGNDVTIISNQRPGFIDRLPLIPGRDAVRFIKLKYDLLRPPDPLVFDLWIVVQERSLNGRFFSPVLENIRRHGTPVVLLTFETPNWQEALLGPEEDSAKDALLKEAASLGAQCLCSTREGQRWAQAYFPHLKETDFHVLSPPVTACWFPGEVDRDERLILAFIRRSHAHKGFSTIKSLLDQRIRGHRLVLVDGHGTSFELENFARKWSQRCGAEITLRNRISDDEKFRLIKSARLVLFPSLFEGFGLPPAEAGYWGTPVLCYDLPVLREIYGDTLLYVPAGDVHAFADAMHRELARKPDFLPSAPARHVGDFGRWRDDVARVFSEVRKRMSPPRRGLVASGSYCPRPVVFDQVGDWNKDDTARSAGWRISDCQVVSFTKDLPGRVTAIRSEQFLQQEETMIAPAGATEDLRGKLLRSLELLDDEMVFLTEDTLVCPRETVVRAAEQLKAADACGVAIPVRLHFQENDTRHYRTATGEVLGACGVFRREPLIELLRSAKDPGNHLQPVLDLSYLIVRHGQRLAALSEGHADRLPPRHFDVRYDLLPGGRGTWHCAWSAERPVEQLGPFPCLRSDSADELARLVEFRLAMMDLLADDMARRVSRAVVAKLAELFLVLHPECGPLLAASDPFRTFRRFHNSYVRFGRAFLTAVHMRVFVERFLMLMAPHPLPEPSGAREREIRSILQGLRDEYTVD